MPENENVSLLDVEFPPNEPIELASEDFAESDIPFIPPGEYTNLQRTIEGRQPFPDRSQNPPVYKFLVDFGENGLVSKDGTVIKFPPRYYMDSKMRDVTYGGVGKTSSLNRYLVAVGLDSKGSSDLKNTLLESQGIPVVVVVELEDDYRERPEGRKAYKTSFFKVGDHFVPAVKKDGVVIKARPRIARFKKA